MLSTDEISINCTQVYNRRHVLTTCLSCFDTWSLAGPGETAPSKISQFPDMVNNTPVSTHLLNKPVRPEPPPQQIPCLAATGLLLCTDPPILVLLGISIGQQVMALTLQTLQKLFRLSNPKLPQWSSFALLIPPHGNHSKGSYPCVALTVCLLTDSGDSQQCPAWHVRPISMYP